MNFWKNKTVLVTGHTGFKGSWLSLWLQRLEANVIGYSLPPPTKLNLFTLASVEKDMKSIIADVRDGDKLQETIQQCNPDILFHMAAQPLVRYAYHYPIETYATNVMGTLHVLEAARQSDTIKAIVNITTDKCYENQEWHWGYRENDRLGGRDPYSNSKACAELVTSAYRDSYLSIKSVGLATARAGNVIGGGDWAEDRLIPDLIRAFLTGKSVSIRNPQALRPWQHVLEPLAGYLLLAEHLYHQPDLYAESWNFGPYDQDIRPVYWIADFVSKQLNHHQAWIHDQAEHPHEATYLKLDCAKATSRLSWQPQWNLEESLKKTICWYQAYQAGANMYDFTLSQIDHFVNQSINTKGDFKIKNDT